LEKVKENIRNRLNNIFQDVFDDEKIEIFEEMTAEDIDEWDSLMHVTLVLAVEKEFDIRLNASEIGKLQNVGTMLILLEKYVEKG
jgi:acyl carrier protein|tara:strand:+ start:210 stop:464 length:255 start_codon:yes stop_codon:yes gene_type:complete